MTLYQVWFRMQVVTNTDAWRRCYHGVNFFEKVQWSEWALVAPYSSEEAALSSAEAFKVINPTREYQVRPIVSEL